MSKKCMHFAFKILAILEPFHSHPVKIGERSRQGHLRVRKLHTFYFKHFGNPIWRALPRGHLRVKNCIHFISNFFAIPRPFHPPRKSLASATAGAPACQKIAYILFPKFWQSPSPSTHPVKIWRALPRGGTCVFERGEYLNILKF